MSAQTVTKGLPARSEVPVELTWDLTTIYKTDAEWEAEFAQVKTELPKLGAYKGRLVESGQTLLEAFRLRDKLSQQASKLYVYANMHLHEDTANGTYQALATRAATLSHELDAEGSFLTPEILSIAESRLADFIAGTSGLELYKFKLDELNRQRPHIRSAEVEALLAKANDVCDTPDNVYEQFSNADLQLPIVEDAQGNKVQLTQGNYVARFLQSRNRNERKTAFEAMLGAYKQFRNTFGALYQAQVKKDIFISQARNYTSSIEAALNAINVPVAVYDTLISTVHANLPTLNRYLNLRKRILQVDELHMYDLYVPIVKEADDRIEWNDAKEKVLAALQPLGSEYIQALTKGLESRWIDVVESKGKRSGAYSWGTYGTNPFMLLNWQNNINNMFTLAHEAGHSMHSFFTRKTQPFPYGNYSIFVAEVASTCNEALLTHYLLKTVTDTKLRTLIINDALEGFRTTLYRQTLFAQFEREAHAKAEAGEALTPDSLCAMFKGINQQFYGDSCTVDDVIENEWMRIPHFYSSFYVYQYATGISAATALSQQIISEGEPAVKRYLRFLSSGSSDYSINLLRDAGVDLSTPAPIQQALDTFKRYLDEFESTVR